MRVEDAEEWTQAQGQSLAGQWRMILLGEKLGVPKALGLSTADWVNDRLGGYVRLTVDDREATVRELHDTGVSNRTIARVVGISPSTVAAILNPVPVQTGHSEIKEPQVRDAPAVQAGHSKPEPSDDPWGSSNGHASTELATQEPDEPDDPWAESDPWAEDAANEVFDAELVDEDTAPSGAVRATQEEQDAALAEASAPYVPSPETAAAGALSDAATNGHRLAKAEKELIAIRKNPSRPVYPEIFNRLEEHLVALRREGWGS